MNLPFIIESKLKQLGLERSNTLIKLIEKDIAPTLEAKAVQLITPRIIRRAFALQLKEAIVPKEPKEAL